MQVHSEGDEVLPNLQRGEVHWKMLIEEDL